MKVIDFRHLKVVGESYWQHLSWCMYASSVFVLMIILSVIHGLFPFLLANTPDKVLVNFINKFRERRERTGQAQRYPEKTIN